MTRMKIDITKLIKKKAEYIHLHVFNFRVCTILNIFVDNISS